MTRPLTRAQTMRAIAARTDDAARGQTVIEFLSRMRDSGADATTMFRGVSETRMEQIAAGEIQRVALSRQVPFELRKATSADDLPNDGFTLEGHGAVFDSETEINSWEGNFVEKIRAGAFRKSLREQTPKMQFDHGNHPLLGGLPLGRWHVAEEDTRGMHLAGRMYDNWLVEPFRQAMTGPDASVDGMSFRFSVVREEWTDAQGKRIKDDNELFELLYFGAGDRGPITRELVELKCPEAGPVVWPAYRDTDVGARSADGGTLTIDLAAIRLDPRRLADIVALFDVETAAAERAAVLDDKTARLAAAVGASTDDAVHTDGVHTDSVRSTEPLVTDTSADGHPTPDGVAPPVAEESAGGHSPRDQRSETRPVNPTDRRSMIRGEYRHILERTLALPDS